MEIIIFAILAGYLFFRLWNVLGTRTGYEKRVDLPQVKPKEATEDKVVILPRQRPVTVNPETELLKGIEDQVKKIQKIDGEFDADMFLRAAKSAFTSIIKAYNTSNHRLLKQLLCLSVYEQFAAAIDQRQEKGLRQETEIEHLEAEIIDVQLLKKIAQISVRFQSEQMQATFDADGQIIDNPNRIKIPVTDLWTFERDLQSDDPTWMLKETRTENA